MAQAWVPMLKLARAWLRAGFNPKMDAVFEREFASRIKQTSYEAAVWGALGKAGLPEASRHLKELVTVTTCRMEADGTCSIDLGAKATQLAPGKVLGCKEASGAPSVAGLARGLPKGVSHGALKAGGSPVAGGTRFAQANPGAKPRSGAARKRLAPEPVVPREIKKALPGRQREDIEAREDRRQPRRAKKPAQPRKA